MVACRTPHVELLTVNLLPFAEKSMMYPRRGYSRPRALRLVILFGLLRTALCSIVSGAETIESVQQSATEWIRIRAETARFMNGWAGEREVLQNSLSAEKAQLKLLTEKRDGLDTKTKGVREEIDQLKTRNASASGSLSRLDEHLQQLGQRLTALRPAFPPRLSAALELPYRTLGDKSQTTAVRAQQVFTILNRCGQFNKTVTYSEETISVPEQNNPKLMEIVYWGLAAGYALDRNSKSAYLGRVVENQWRWVSVPAIYEPLSRAIAMYKGKNDPQAVELPAQIAHPFVTSP